MLVEKEVIAPGEYWYVDDKSGLPRMLKVTPAETKWWCDQGSKMLSAGLKVPVPYEHDFQAHPMTPKDKLLNNAGEVREYRLKDFDDPVRGRVKDALFSVVDVQDPEVKSKIGHNIRWTSPWFNSFTDGSGKQWNNVIAHLALTTKPRITAQQPFPSTTAALSMATEVKISAESNVIPADGYCLSRAGLLLRGKPAYAMAFSLYSGAALGEFPPPKKSKDKPKPGAAKPGATEPPPGGDLDADNPDGAAGMDPDGADMPGSDAVDLPPLGDQAGDVSMEEVLCDLLRALGVDCQHDGDESQFKRNLYAAAMKKVHDLTSKGMNKEEDPKPGAINAGKAPGSPGANPLVGQVQQEQQPMYMSLGGAMSQTLSLEDIQKIPDPTMRSIALSMFNENSKLRAEADADRKKLNSLNDAKLKEENAKRQQRVAWLSRVSPKAKVRLEKLLADPGMALSMGDGGAVVDPMADMLSAIEDTIGELPRMLTIDSAALGVQPHPKDNEDEMTEEESDKMADRLVKRPPVPAKNGV